MDKLPYELLEHICAYVAQTDKDTLKSLRLVSRVFIGIPVGHIFRTLVIYPHADKWENINRIARNPSLAGAVETIQLVHQSWLVAFYFYERWRQATQYVLRDLKKAWRNDDHSLFGGPYPGDQVIIERAWKTYCYWRDGESLLIACLRKATLQNQKDQDGGERAFKMRDLELHKLPRFRKLQTIGHEELRRLNTERLSREHPYLTRRDVETLIDERAKDYGGNVQDRETLSLFLQSQERAGKAIPELQLHRLDELLLRNDRSKFDEARSRKLDFSCLDKLELNVANGSHTNCYLTLSGRQRPVISGWVPSISTLGELTIIDDPKYDPAIDALEILAPLSFSKLRLLLLKGVTTREQALRRLLRTVQDSLTSLHIEEPVIWRSQDTKAIGDDRWGDSWPDLRARIAKGSKGQIFNPKLDCELILGQSFWEKRGSRALAPRCLIPRAIEYNDGE